MSSDLGSDPPLYSEGAWRSYARVWDASEATREDLLDAVVATLGDLLPGHRLEPSDPLVEPLAEMIDQVRARSVVAAIPTALEEEKAARDLAEREDIPDPVFALVLEGMRRCIWAAWERLIVAIPEGAVDVGDLVAATSVARQAIDRRVWRAQQLRDAVELARRDHARRDYFALLRDLVDRGVEDAAVLERAIAAGFEPERRYRLARVPRLGGDQERATAALRAAGPAPREEVLAATIVGDGSLLCVLERVPDVPPGVLVAISPEGTLSEFPAMASWAERVERAALRTGRAGVVGLGDVGAMVAISADEELGAALVADWLGPLVDPAHELLRVTLRCHLESFGDVSAVARRLGVHANTVRHRIRRAVEITGRDLATHDARLATWWALVWTEETST